MRKRRAESEKRENPRADAKQKTTGRTVTTVDGVYAQGEGWEGVKLL